MTGYVLAWSPCLTCHRVFGYNPHRVPSSSAVTGSREPVCRSCMDRINAKRAELGLEAFTIHPDAYDALPEEEL
jgi:hypothetical protein